MKTPDNHTKDTDLTSEPEALKEIHAVRLKIHNERKGMSPSEYNAIVRQRAIAFFASDSSSPPSPCP